MTRRQKSKRSENMDTIHRKHSLKDLVTLALNADLYQGMFKDEADVRSVMRQFGHDNFDPSDEAWKTYKANLGAAFTTRMTQKLLKEKSNTVKDPESVLDNPICPVCGGKRRWLTREEKAEFRTPKNFMGATEIWACDAVPGRPLAHFFADRVSRIMAHRKLKLESAEDLVRGPITEQELMERYERDHPTIVETL